MSQKYCEFTEGGVTYRSKYGEQDYYLYSNERKHPAIGTVRFINGRLYYLREIVRLFIYHDSAQKWVAVP